MTKQQIKDARSLTIEDLVELGFTLSELFDNGEITTDYYAPSDSYEYFDGFNYYNKSGQLLRNPSEYDTNSEGYTPFGDE